MATVSRQSTGSKSQAFRVLYDKGQDPNVEITSLLQKRQHNIKGKTSLKKKQRTHDVSITGTHSNTKSSRLNEQLAKQNEQMSLRHAREVQQIHQFYTSQISSLQANWEVERAQFQETIEILEQQLEEEKEENSRIVEELETALDESENYNHNLSLLYKTVQQTEEEERQERKKQSILSRLRMEMEQSSLCTVCDDYDLCEKCALQGKTSKEHERNHPMEQIPPSDFARIRSPSQTYTCPYCDSDGMSVSSLCKHVFSKHIGDPKPVVCPICASGPGGDPSRVSVNFQGHLQARHFPSSSQAGESLQSLMAQLQYRQESSSHDVRRKDENVGMRNSTDLPKIMRLSGSAALDPEPSTPEEQQEHEKEKQLRTMFVQDLLFSTLT